MANQNQNEGGKSSGGNFKDDPKRASEAGKKGGEASNGGKGSSSGGSKSGGSSSSGSSTSGSGSGSRS